MPHITPTAKERLQRSGLGSIATQITTPGELNYCITTLCLEFIRVRGPVSYHAIRGIVGDLECVKLEFYRLLAAPYENVKRIENGDVYREYQPEAASETGGATA